MIVTIMLKLANCTEPLGCICRISNNKYIVGTIQIDRCLYLQAAFVRYSFR